MVVFCKKHFHDIICYILPHSMSLSESVQYTHFDFFHFFGKNSLDNIVLIREQIQKKIRETVIGEPISLLLSSDIPGWQYILVFEELRRSCPEIVIEISPSTYILLYSILPKDKFTHSQTIRVFPELLFEPDTVPEHYASEVTFDVSDVPRAHEQNCIDTILYIKQRVKYTEKLVLTGTSDPLTTLLSYVVWIKYAQSIEYKEQDQFLKLV